MLKYVIYAQKAPPFYYGGCMIYLPVIELLQKTVSTYALLCTVHVDPLK